MVAIRFWLTFVALAGTGILAFLLLRTGTASPLPAPGLAQTSNPQQHRPAPADSGTNPAWSAPTAAGALRPPPLVGAHGQSTRDAAACSLPPTKSRHDTTAQLVYRWTDEQGRLQLSDQAPDDRPFERMDLSASTQDFTLSINGEGVNPPQRLRNQLAAGAKRMYDKWHEFLGPQRLRQSRIELLLVASPERFRQYRGNSESSNLPISGFYRLAENRAYVKYNRGNEAAIIATSLHEVSHLITASHLGVTPLWLTEGLAEYFEQTISRDQSAAIYPNLRHLDLLRRQPLPSLAEFTAKGRGNGWNEHRDRNYAQAWSLIYFLMGQSEGRHALKTLIEQQHRRFCKPFAAGEALARAYPGGISALQRNWRAWLDAGIPRPHHI